MALYALSWAALQAKSRVSDPAAEETVGPGEVALLSRE